MSTLKLFLLGSPRLERNGEPLKAVTRKSMVLLAYLATIGETHNREALVTLLWPELESSRARAGPRRNLSTLKKTLAGEWLVANRGTIGLDRDTDAWVDVKQFHQSLETRRTHDHPATNICTDCLSIWPRAASDWQG